MYGFLNKNFSRQSIGILLMLSHCFFNSLGAVLFKVAHQEYNIIQIIFIYNFLQCITFFLLSRTKIKACQLSGTNIKWHFLRSIFSFTAFLLCSYSFSQIDITEVRAIITIDPVITAMLALYFFNERITKAKVIALMLTAIGALILLHPSNIPFSFPVFTAILSAFSFGIYNNLTKKISHDKSINSVFLKSFFTCIYSAIPAIYFWHSIASISDLILFLFISLFFLLSSLSTFNAFKRADLSYLMPFHFVGILFTAFLSYLLLNEVVGFLTYLGSFIIIVGTLPLFYKPKVAARKELAQS
jgi:drug/metabolite transporter (DMT)-like permease